MERFKYLDFLIHIVSLQALMANCDIDQEADRDSYKDKVLLSTKVKQIAMLEMLTSHVWIHEVFDPKGPLLKINIDYPIVPGMEHDTPDSLLGRRMRKARLDLLAQLSHGEMKLWPSVVPPSGHVVRSIQMLSFATAYYSTYCTYIISTPAGSTLDTGGGVSWNVASGSDFEPHTTNLNRAVSLCSALMLVRDYIRANNSTTLEHCSS